MSGKSLLFLLALVGLLLWFAFRQQAIEADMVRPYSGPLLPIADREDVRELRWDHVARGEHIALEKREGTWHLTDPREYPAAPDRMRLLMDGIFTNAEEIPAPDVPRIAEHFEPPRAVLTIIEQHPESGEATTHKVELGSLDVDGMQIEARYNGRYLRILRNIDTALLSSVSDLRDKRVFRMRPSRIIHVERSGVVAELDQVRDLTFSARREGPNWQLHRPQRVHLDPGAMQIWTRFLSNLRCDDFVSDVPDPDLKRYGLDNPDFKLSIGDGGGRKEELWAVTNSSGAWLCKVVGRPHIYALNTTVADSLIEDWPDLRDTRLLRAYRNDIAHIDLAVGSEVIRLSQGADRDSAWTVASRSGKDGAFGDPVLADKNRVEELLGDLESQEIVSWAGAGETGDDWFAPSSSTRRITFVFRYNLEGERASARVGMPAEHAGKSLLPYLREGDELVGFIDSELDRWWNGGGETWRSPLVWNLVEGRLQKLTLTTGSKSQTFQRKLQGSWRYGDRDASPVELLPALDHLVYLRAEAYLPQADWETLEDVVTVEFATQSGATMSADVGRTQGGQVQIQTQGQRAVAHHQPLWELLQNALGR